jgi:integrase
MYLAKRMEDIRQATVYGIRPQRTFRQAATKYLDETQKVSIVDDAMHLRALDAYIGDLPIQRVNMDTLQPHIVARRRKGIKTSTINHALQVVRRILHLSAGEWFDENGLSWLANPPHIKFSPETDRRDPYPLSWDEQNRLFQELPSHLAQMALFKVNTGCREAEVTGLRWEWETLVPELGVPVFLIPGSCTKNRQSRVIVINRVAQSVVDQQRGIHSEFVFTFKGKPVRKMYSTAWKKARQRVGMKQVRVHDLRHTFGRRLRAAGVSFEDRQDLLGHKSGRVTTHYSAPELTNLLEAANQVCETDSRKSPALTILKQKVVSR